MAKKNFKPTEDEAVEIVVPEEAAEDIVAEVKEAPVVKKPVEVKPVESKKGKVINCERLNVRKGPSTDDEVVSVLTVGTLVPVDKVKDNKDWYKTTNGYVMSKFIKII